MPRLVSQRVAEAEMGCPMNILSPQPDIFINACVRENECQTASALVARLR